MVRNLKLLPESSSKASPAMNGHGGAGYDMSQEALTALGEKFLGVMEAFLRLHPDKPDKALDAAAKNLPKRSYRRGGKIINVNPIRV